MTVRFTPVELEHRIPGALVRERALQMWSGMAAAGTAPAGRDYTDLVPEVAEALLAGMLAEAAARGITLPAISRTMDPAYGLRITFSFANGTDATAFKIALL